MTKETKTMDIVAYGLTKREYFAALMAQSLASNPALLNGEDDGAKDIPMTAVIMADALIKELEKEGGE